MRAEYSFTIRWHAPPSLQGVINYKPVRISDSIWQRITAANNLHAFTAIVDQLTVFFRVYMPCDKFSNLSEERTPSPGSKPCSGGCWISWEGKNVSIRAHSSLLALTRASKSLPLAPTHSILLPAPTALTGQRFFQLPHIGVTFVSSQPPQHLP